KTRPTSLSQNSRPDGVRSSLPANSTQVEKVKPKARTSIASTKAPGGSFLERMMRPTQSSAQKTHEKVETKSPPREAATRLKRKSGESAYSNSNSEGKEATAEASSDAQKELVSEVAGVQPLPLTDSSAQKTDEVAQEVATALPEITGEE
ncbi:MAG: hypothetical protein Q9217_007075, partial [Psora testacea]